MRNKPCYFQAFSLKDGTIMLAIPTTKPPCPKSNPRKGIDEDGVWWWITQDHKDTQRYEQAAKMSAYAAIATSLNTKRILRSMVVERLDRIEAMLRGLTERLDRLAPVESNPESRSSTV